MTSTPAFTPPAARPRPRARTAMIADAESLRTEQFEQVGALIERDVDAILDRWEKGAMAEQPNARRLHHADLRDHLPELLRALGESLAGSGNGKGHAPYAKRHASERWEDGWSLDEVVRDYQILRRVLLEYADAHLGRPLTLRENMAVGMALDEAISASLERYARHRVEAAKRA